jgi:hypothetical protein
MVRPRMPVSAVRHDYVWKSLPSSPRPVPCAIEPKHRATEGRCGLQPRVDRLAFKGQDAEDALCGSSTALPDVVAVRVGPPSSNSRLERTVFAAMTATLAVLSAYVAVC